MRNTVLLNIGIGLVILVVFTTTSLPSGSHFWGSLQDAGHGLAMCFAAFICISTMVWISPQHLKKIFIITPLALFALGILIEAVQFVIGRGAYANDILLNTAGIVAGLCFSTVFSTKFRSLMKLFWVILGFFLLTWCIHKPAYLVAQRLLSPALPVTENVDQFAENALIEHGYSTYNIGNHQAVWPLSEGNSLRVTYSPSRWSHVRFTLAPEDWSNYSALTREVFNAEADVVRLKVKLDYKTETGLPGANMKARRDLQPGHTSLNMSFEEFAKEVYGGEPNFANVERMTLYVSNPSSNVTLYFDNLWLQ